MSHEIYRMIRLLEANKVHFELSRHRPDSLMLTATLVGERIEIDVFEDGHVEYSRFCGNEDVEDDIPILEILLRKQGRK
ncbi:hypothetical protein [Methylobacterium sp. Leaf93]|uniref:hypothetical protein n=1 Tax=Methylobacterium sp. Leaf93 TaxID=1736249 RepID=UPI0006FD5758|nr:hypothetical protein [Methylobacterium sp. Leaf93]KQP04521.1 hypothetical protein ASF26_10290 [Methylobacterium sp. Leaf93]